MLYLHLFSIYKSLIIQILLQMNWDIRYIKKDLMKKIYLFRSGSQIDRKLRKVGPEDEAAGGGRQKEG